MKCEWKLRRPFLEDSAAGSLTEWRPGLQLAGCVYAHPQATPSSSNPHFESQCLMTFPSSTGAMCLPKAPWQASCAHTLHAGGGALTDKWCLMALCGFISGSSIIPPRTVSVAAPMLQSAGSFRSPSHVLCAACSAAMHAQLKCTPTTLEKDSVLICNMRLLGLDSRQRCTGALHFIVHREDHWSAAKNHRDDGIRRRQPGHGLQTRLGLL